MSYLNTGDIAKMSTKALPVIITLLAVAGIISTPVYANEDSENACMEKADAQNVPDDKYEEFVIKCIEEAKAKAGE